MNVPTLHFTSLPPRGEYTVLYSVIANDVHIGTVVKLPWLPSLWQAFDLSGVPVGMRYQSRRQAALRLASEFK